MKKRKIFIVLSTFFLSFLLVGCANESDLQAIVLDTSDTQILIGTELTPETYIEIEDLTADEIIIEEMENDDVYYGLLWLNTENVNDFKKGDHIEAWIDDAIMQSYPAQGNAKEIKHIK